MQSWLSGDKDYRVYDALPVFVPKLYVLFNLVSIRS